jgi:hypothetical protein
VEDGLPTSPASASAPEASLQPAPLPSFAPEPVVAPAIPPPDYKDRSTGLTVFGVFQIILGLLSALMIPFAALGMLMSRFAPGGSTMRPAQFVSSVASYAFIAAGFIVLGVGSLRMKRWARALTLVTSWYWLVMGLLLTILLTAMMPVAVRSALAQARQNAPSASSPEFMTGIMAVMLTFMIVFAALFLIAVPIAFIVFYGRRDVEMTCYYRDPIERWTDRAPLPVLGASVVLLIGALYAFVVGVSTPLFLFFGQYLTGVRATACFLVLAAVDIYIAVGIFRLQSSAWWIAILLAPVRLLSMILTYSKADLMQAYSKVGFSDVQLQLMNSNPMFRNHIILWWSLISMFLFFGYLLWLKRYFKVPAARQADPLPATGVTS